MRVLHLMSEFRWTGLAEPVVNLVQATQRQGVEVYFACRAVPARRALSRSATVADMARRRGVEPLLCFCLNRHRPFPGAVMDLWALRRFIRRRGIDIVQTHRSHDHLIGGLAARIARCGRVVRMNHTAMPLRPSWGNRFMLSGLTDGYIGFSHGATEADTREFKIPSDRAVAVEPAVDLERFDGDRPRADIRGSLGLTDRHVLVGVVARMQPHRRFDVLFEAVRLAHDRVPQLRVVLLGGGTDIQAVAREPLVAAGLDQIVHVVGRRRDDYADYLAGLDFKIFLMPGSDGTCRAVREAMAMGKPVIAARRGMLAELVSHERAGLVVEDTPQNLAKAIIRLALDEPLRRNLGATAKAHARQHFRMDRQADAVLAFYERLRSTAS